MILAIRKLSSQTVHIDIHTTYDDERIIELYYASIGSVKLASFVKFTGTLFKEEMRRLDWDFRKLEIQTS